MTDAEFEAENSNLIALKIKSIEFVQKYRHEACAVLKPGFNTKMTCEKVCDTIVARRRAEIVALELSTLALRLQLENRVEDRGTIHTKVDPPSELNAMNDITNRMIDQVKLMFPPKKSLAK